MLSVSMEDVSFFSPVRFDGVIDFYFFVFSNIFLKYYVYAPLFFFSIVINLPSKEICTILIQYIILLPNVNKFRSLNWIKSFILTLFLSILDRKSRTWFWNALFKFFKTSVKVYVYLWYPNFGLVTAFSLILEVLLAGIFYCKDYD